MDELAEGPSESAPAGLFPASFAQRRLWFLDQMVPDSAAYNVPLALRVEGQLDVAALEKALHSLVERHESLRTTFAEIDGDPVQIVSPEASVVLGRRSMEAMEEGEVRAALQAEAELPFDLSRGPLMRSHLLTVGPQEFILMLTFHHIVADGWSMGVVVEELLEFYQAARAGRDPQLPALPIQYADYALWQRDWLTGERRDALFDYWRGQLADPPPTIAMPGRKERSAVANFEGSYVPFKVPDSTRADLMTLSRRLGVTPFMILLSAFDVLVARCTDETDIAVGTPIANRNRAELEGLIGFFVNTLVLRADLAGDPSFAEIVARVRDASLGGYEHQDLPFEYLVEELAPERDTSRNPLFQVMFVHQTASVPALELEGVRFEMLRVDNQTAKFDLQMFCGEREGGLEGSLEYATDVFDRETAEWLVGAYLRILEAAVAAPERRLSQLPLASDPEIEQVVEGWNRTRLDYGPFQPIPRLFEQQAARTPDAVALEFASTRMSYADLEGESRRVALGLQALGIGPESRVGIYSERSLDLVVALLAVLRCGAAYVPIETEWPADRIESVLADADVKVVLAAGPRQAEGLFGKARILSLDDCPDRDEELIVPALDPQGLAYVIFTSGSTGRPKGVGIAHEGLQNRLAWMQQAYALQPTDCVLQKTPFGFDVSVWEFFWPLIQGARLAIAEPGAHRDPGEIGAAMQKHGVTVAHFVPTMLEEFESSGELSRCSTLRYVIASGEALSGDLVGRFYRSGTRARLENLYGPTEATVDVTSFSCSAEQESTPPIGSPIANVQTYVLDRYGEAVPAEVEGELYLGGIQLARGYEGQPGRTAERFVPHPWEPGKRLYRTGDVARWRSDGELEYLGRRDGQIKLHGQRVELGEIEAALREQPGVRDAAVLLREDSPGDKRLVGYLVGGPTDAMGHGPGASSRDLRRIEEWTDVYEETYRSEPQDPGFDVAGWVSSYDGQPVDPVAMREWVDARVDLVCRLARRRVLEIGCGTGLLATRLAPEVEEYHALDLSGEVLNRLDRWSEASGVSSLRLIQAAAHEGWAIDHPVDTVILNSVAQYFPSADYLEEVLDRALSGTEDGGHIFVGDVRHAGLAETFALELEWARASGAARVGELLDLAEERRVADRELLLAPGFFHRWADSRPRVGAVELRWEPGRHHHEMTRYRYDVILHVGVRPALVAVEWAAWDTLDDLAGLRDLLSSTEQAAVGITDLPNARLVGPIGLLEQAREKPSGRTHELVAPVAGVDPEQLRELGEALGWEVSLLVTPDGHRGLLDVLYRRPGTAGCLSGSEDWSTGAPLATDPTRQERSREWVSGIREQLRSRIPQSLIPSALMTLSRLPVTANGKLDRRSLPAPDASAVDRERYVAPANLVERALANIWTDVLGVDRIGREDNFFALGGDSILSIQVVSRAHREGLEITPRQMFENQTIAELAGVVGARRIVEADQDVVTGEVPILPIQRWFSRMDLETRDHWNQALFLDVHEWLEDEPLTQAVQALVLHHDVLRLRLHKGPDDWTQEIASPDDESCFRSVDLSGVSPAEQVAAIERTAAGVQSSLSVTDGPLFRVVRMALGEDEADRLLLVAHHLVVDVVSWRILAEDLELGYRQAASGRPVRLPRKTTSYPVWARRWLDWARSDEAARDAAVWLDRPWSAVDCLPVEGDVAGNTEGRTRRIRTEVSREITHALLHEVPSVHRSSVEESLLTVLGEVLVEWCGHKTVVVDVEGHGREDVFEDMDVTRTVGWFASRFPLFLAGGEGNIGVRLRELKEQRRGLPLAGMSYGLLREISNLPAGEALRELPEPEVAFNYLGRVDAAVDPTSPFAPATEDCGPLRAAGSRRPHLLDVTASIVDEKLSIGWGYAEGVLSSETVERLARHFREALKRLVAYAREPGVACPTASDFPAVSLQPADLDRLMVTYGPGIEDILPMTPMQEGLLWHSRAEGQAYVEQIRFRMRTDLDEQALEQAWKDVSDRHRALRTAFCQDPVGGPLQVVLGTVAPIVDRHDWQGQSEATQQASLTALLEADRKRGFATGQAPLSRLTLIRMGADDRVLVWTHHHAILDGWSVPIVFADVSLAYSARCAGKAPSFAPLVTPRFPRPDLEQGTAEAYWRQQLDGFAGPIDVGGHRSSSASSARERERVYLTADETRDLMAAGRAERVTLSTFVQAGWAAVLSRTAATRDVLFGVTTSGRPADLPGAESMVGLFINSLPLRVKLPPARKLGDWLRDLQSDGVALRDWEHVPLVEIQQWSGLPGGVALFDSLVAVENYPIDASLEGGRGPFGAIEVDYQDETHYPLTLVVAPGERLRLQLGYDAGRFSKQEANSLLADLRRALLAMVRDPKAPVGSLAVAGDAEASCLLERTATARDYGTFVSIAEEIEAQARATPEAVALVFGGNSLSYAELEERTGRIADALVARGTRPDARVGLLLERSLDLVLALVGILRAGAAYVPLETEWPDRRLSQVIGEASVSLVLTAEDLQDRLRETSAEPLCVSEAVAQGRSGWVSPSIHPENIAYVIFTSGSTGRPKGVSVPHAGLRNRLEWMQRSYELAGRDAVLQKTSYGFDVSVWEFLWPLRHGARLVIAAPGAHRDPQALGETIRRNQVSTIHFVPTMLEAFVHSGELARCPSLRRVIASGEVLSGETAARFYESGAPARLYNLYGPTEASIDVTAWACEPGSDELPPIGAPIDNVETYVLDESHRLVPDGAAGELYLGGVQLARGYVGRPGLTAEKFVPHPWVAGARLYRTGDLVRWRADGVLTYLGRRDAQVKLRGQRIELGEIEAVLRAAPGVREAAVQLISVGSDSGLAGYVVGEIRGDQAREHLQECLPAYMVPATVTVLPEMPRTLNGKVDRRALPAPNRPEVAYQKPEGPMESRVAEIWADVLDLERVGRIDDFFNLGGHSLRAAQIIARLREETGVELSTAAFFAAANVREVARVLEEGQISTTDNLDRIAALLDELDDDDD